MRFSIILSFLWTVSIVANASPLSQGRRTLGLEPRYISPLDRTLFLVIHQRDTAQERWGLTFGKAGTTFFMPEENSRTPYAPLVTGQAVNKRKQFRASVWTLIDLEQEVSFASMEQRTKILRAIEEIKMILNQEFRPSTKTTEFLDTLRWWNMPKEFRRPGTMNLPQIAYGGPPFQDDLYPVGGTTMNYVRNVLEYLMHEHLIDKIPQKFEDEFKSSYRKIWLAHWQGTEEGEKVIQMLKDKQNIDLLK